MATISELVVKIVADTAGLDKGINDATKSIKDVGNASEDADGKAAGLAEQFGELKDTFVAVGKAIYDSIQAFGEAEIAASRLDTIATMNGLTDGAERVKKLADELQNLVGIDGDLVVQLGAELLAQGKSVDQTEELIRAAAELSAMTGGDLQTSVKQLTATYSGTSGRLGQIIPEFKDLTEAQLKNGDAIDIINKKYGGLAASQTDLVIPATNRLKETLDDVKDEFGRAFAPAFVTMVNALADAINVMMPTIVYIVTHDIGSMFVDLVKNLLGVEDATTKWEKAQKAANDAETEGNRIKLLAIKNLADQKTGVETMEKATKRMTDAELENMRIYLKGVLLKTTGTSALTQLSQQLEAVEKEIADRKKVRTDEARAAEKAANEKAANEKLAKAKETADEIAKDEKEADDKKLADVKRTVDKIVKANKEAAAEKLADAKKNADEIVKAEKEADDKKLANTKENANKIAEANKKATDGMKLQIKELEEQISEGMTRLYDSLESAVGILAEMVVSGYEKQIDAITELAEIEKIARDGILAGKLATLDAETQAYLIANGLMEQTTMERLEEELAAALASGDTKKAADLQREIDRTIYLEGQAKKRTDIEDAAKIEEKRIFNESEKTKANIKYKADLWSWGSSLALAISGGAQAIIRGFADLGPIGGAIAALGTGIATGIQIAAINANKPVAPALARGSDFTAGGSTIVGEEGPELVNMPRGASVTPNTRGGSASGNTFIINSPVAVTPSVAAQEYTRMVRNLAFEGVL